MIATVSLTDEDMPSLAAAVVDEMLRRGVAMVEPERLRPFSVTEAAAELGVSAATVRRDVDAGRLDRIPNTSRVLVPVASVRARQGVGVDVGVAAEKAS